MTRKLHPSHTWLVLLFCAAAGLSQAGCDIQRATGPEEAKAAPDALRQWIAQETTIAYQITTGPWSTFNCVHDMVYVNGFTYDPAFYAFGLDDYQGLYDYLYNLYGGQRYQPSIPVAFIPVGESWTIRVRFEYVIELRDGMVWNDPNHKTAYRYTFMTFSNSDMEFISQC